jgi:hypothetical protein
MDNMNQAALEIVTQVLLTTCIILDAKTHSSRMKVIELYVLAFLLVLGGCSKQHDNQNRVGMAFPSVTGQSLDKIQQRQRHK